ncbi:MAG: hypothetical protein CMH63_01995 [Nanoarchaeota archaeon]|nr:hypothetical protein [Nanoarchaeota archaeon]|tara:strand:+ start:10868 stop:11758 length:891 start_codon:yes stop_codon:yes gene_type:complete
MKKLKLDVKDLANRLDISTKKLFKSTLMGNYQTAYKGEGLEFVGFRKYTQGDDAAKIDWKATVRSNDILIKEFMEERSLHVFFLMDASSTMLFGSKDKLKAQYASEFIASMAYAIMHASDSVGFGMFNEKMVKSFMPTSGEKQYYMILNNLVDMNLYGRGFDLVKPLKFYTDQLTQGSLFFIVSDFIGLKGQDWIETLKITARKLDVIGIMIRDERDRMLPEDHMEIVVESTEDNRKKVVNPATIKREYEMYVKREEARIQEIFKEVGAEFLMFTTGEDFVNPMIKFFRRRLAKYR